MAKVVFWSPEKESSGCTSTAIAVSSLMGITHKVSNLLIDATPNGKKIESSYTPYEDLVTTNGFGDTNLGMNAIMRLIKSNKLAADLIQNYSKPVLKGRLDILYSAYANNQVDERESLTSMSLIAKNAEDVYDIVFLDLEKSTTDAGVLKVLESADVVVCVVSQEVAKLTNVQKEVSSLKELQGKSIMYVIGDYESGSKYNAFNLKIKYKFQDQLFVVPHNYLYSDALNDGNVLDFLYRNINAPEKDYNGEFMIKTKEIVEEIAKRIKIKE